MQTKSFKSLLVAAVVAVGASIAASAPAQAGSKFSIYIGNGSHIGFNHGVHHRKHHKVHRKYRGHRGVSHRGFCGPKKAVRKAWRIGLNRPHVSRIGKNRIAVVGWNRGHRAKVVFAKHTGHCKVVKTRGLY